MIPLGDGGVRRVPLVVPLLIAANVAVFVEELAVPNPVRFVDAFALIPYDVMHGVVIGPPSPPLAGLTLLTALFIHGSLLHIGFNMLFLAVFGPAVEALCGRLRFAVFYLGCGVAGGAAQVAAAPSSHVPVIGASGAIAGVLGAYLVRYPFASIRTLIPIGCFPLLLRLPALLVIGLWAVVQFVTGFGTPAGESGTAYFTHIGGFSAGVLGIGLLVPRGRSRRAR